MEYIPIKIRKNDGFPVNICDSCLQKLSTMCEFRWLVIQSNIKLENFYSAKSLKSGKQDHIKDRNMICVFNQEIEINERKSRSDGLATFAYDDENSLRDSTLALNHSKDTPIKEEVSSNKVSDILGELLDENIDDSSCNNKPAQVPKNEASKEPVRLVEVPLKGVIATRHKKRCYKRLDRSRNINDRQAEMLDNADYKRIVQLPISRREKTLLPVYCPDCNKSFSFQYFVTVHAHLHTGNLPFKCERCEMRFPKRNILNQHMHKHVKIKNNPCDLCDKSFFRTSALKLHKIQVHSTERPHKCEICGKAFKIIFSLQKHIKMHNNEKSHVCEICGKSFIDLGALTNHRRIHSNEKNFLCKTCGKEFTYKRSLKVHMQVHTNEKPYTCDQCGRSFRLSVILKQHMLIHTGEKPFTCEICDKKFRTRSVLVLHRRTHTGETPYPCNFCSSAFKYRHHLAKHKKVHHKDELVQKEQEISQNGV
ncbi:hypothetical protein Trydic_g23429 [Trypoxylus dichotomus]